MIGTVTDVPLSPKHMLVQARKLFPGSQMAARLPGKAQERLLVVDDILLQRRELFPR